MRQIDYDQIIQAVKQAVIQANTRLPVDIVQALQSALDNESSPRARRLLGIILENAGMAARENMALCQDTGMVVVDVEIGQEIMVQGGRLDAAINQGVRDGYQQGFFRKSVINDPFQRINTGDNTPAIVHCNMVGGDQLKITVLPKGAGSENMSRLGMLKPAEGLNGVKDFILQVVKEAGGNPCPPVIVGVGVGGNMEKAALLSKKALIRPVNIRNPREDIARLEEEMLKAINALNIGPQGMGGNTTALAVNIEVYPTHIASLPVAVNLGCHSTRRVTVEI